MKDNLKLTKGTRDLIKTAIEETNSHNRYILCETIAKHIQNRYKGEALEYQLQRMRIPTTGKILEAIDSYFYSHL